MPGPRAAIGTAGPDGVAGAGRYRGGVRGIVDGWDAFELWVTQLWFPFQVLLAIVVLLPLCAVVAVGLDRLTERFDSRSAGTSEPGRRDDR